jgi:hypothetical protein
MPASLEQVRAEAARLRAFLDTLMEWLRPGEEPSFRSTGLCIPTSVLTAHALTQRLGEEWQVTAGLPLDHFSAQDIERYSIADGGLLVCGESCDHFWAVRDSDGLIVDLSADQFGYATVVVARADDSRYLGNLPAALIETNTAQAYEWPYAWRDVWNALHDKSPTLDDIEEAMYVLPDAPPRLRR